MAAAVIRGDSLASHLRSDLCLTQTRQHALHFPQDGQLDIKLRRLNSAELLIFPDTAKGYISQVRKAHIFSPAIGKRI